MNIFKRLFGKKEVDKDELRRQKQREYYKKNREKLLAKSREYYNNHKQEIADYHKQYRAEHLEKVREYERKKAKRYYDAKRSK